MVFKFIDTVIQNLTLNLEALTKDSNLYSMLLYQHRGTFASSATTFGNEYDSTSKFNSFLALAKSENVALVLTPEYSCPWNSIDWLLSDETRWPNDGKLWAICCESITPNEVNTFEDKFNGNNIEIFVDKTPFTNGNGVLLDPLCYIFRCQVNGENKLLVLMQFKTQHMGVWTSPEEQQKYIWGNDIYVLRNSENSIYLFTNICSEAIEFRINDAFQNQVQNRWDHNPYIILNPQMNPQPSHDAFKNFRKSILDYDLKDIISLNWGGGTMFPGMADALIPYSKSSVIIKSDQVDYSNEARFVNNHKKGLYYILRKPNIQVNYLHPKTDVFLIRNQKPSAAGVNNALVRRSGPEVSKVFVWDTTISNFYEIEFVEDNFLAFLNSLHCTNSVCQNLDISFIDKERLINLSSGQVKAKKEDRRWHNIDKLESFLQETDEVVKRFTYVHDDTGLNHRTGYVEVMDVLNSQILSDGTLFPENLASFIGNCTEVMFFNNDGENYKYNLSTIDGSRKATVAYIGRKDEAQARRTLEQLQRIFENGDQSKKLVVVWYKVNANTFAPVCDSVPPKVTDDTSVDPSSIF